MHFDRIRIIAPVVLDVDDMPSDGATSVPVMGMVQTLGLLDNSKSNAGALLGAIATSLEVSHGLEVSTVVRKHTAGGPATDDEIDVLNRCDLVLTATAD